MILNCIGLSPRKEALIAFIFIAHAHRGGILRSSRA